MADMDPDQANQEKSWIRIHALSVSTNVVTQISSRELGNFLANIYLPHDRWKSDMTAFGQNLYHVT